MRLKMFVIFVLVLTFVLSSFAAQTTVTGILTDDMCTKKHMMPGKANADCVRECIKHGATYVVVTEGRVFEVAGNQDQLGAWAGKKVKLTGQSNGKLFTVTSIEGAQ